MRDKVEQNKQARPRKSRAVKPKAAKGPAADANPSKITPVQRRTLVAFGSCRNISRAVREAGSCRATHYKALKKSPRYRAAFEQAQEEFADRLREAAINRAIRGVPRLKFYKGKVVMVPKFDEDSRPILDDKGEHVLQTYVEYEYSDRLLIRLLQAHCPEYSTTTRLELGGLYSNLAENDANADRHHVDTIMSLSAECLKHINT